MRSWGYPAYVSVAEKRAKAAKKLKQLKKKNPHINPIVIEGTAIARTWWGKAWNKNLESYADYHNRIGRGRSYVRHGAVLDLQIGSGQVESLVQGSRSKPYSVTIRIKAMGKTELEGDQDRFPGEAGFTAGTPGGEISKRAGGDLHHPGEGAFSVAQGD